MELINYSESLAKHIRTLFIHVIVPENFLLAVHKHNLDVLTDADIARLRKKLATNISLDVNMDLLDLLCRYKEWFDCVLKVLGDPEIKQQNYVPEFEKLKCEHDIQWNSKKSEKCEESIVCQATDNRSLQSEPDENSSLQSHSDENPVLESQLNENSSLQSEPDTNSFLQSEPDPNSSLHYQSASQPDENCSLLNLHVGNPSLQSETDGNNPSLQSQATGIQGEMNEPLDGTVINNSLTTDSVDTMMGNLTIIEGKGWSMSGGKGKCPTYCQVCELSLTSPQHAEQHYSGKNHKKKVELNTSQDQGDALSNETESPTYCQVCDLTLTSPRHAEQHCSGKNHKKKVELNTSQDQGVH
ncbi:hypothetical protein Btru_075253 [Bulinus truncatus]|nr:hypothetical protein Btru_075253 [Bulinus truncatus]